MGKAGDDAALDRPCRECLGEHAARERLHFLHPCHQGRERFLCLLAVSRDVEDGIAEAITLTE